TTIAELRMPARDDVHSILAPGPPSHEAVAAYLARLPKVAPSPAVGPSCRVVVVVPTLDEERLIEACLDGLTAQVGNDGRPLDRSRLGVVVVDNGSRDRTAERVRAYAARHPDLSLVLLSEAAPGVARARKRGMDYALAQLHRLPAEPRRLLASTDA